MSEVSVFADVDPSQWIASNEAAFAIRDGFPVSPGHSLVIPRRLIANWWEATTEEQRAIFELVDLLKRRIDVEFAPDGYNVGFNDGDAAGQTVFHLHIHVIPRYSGDVDDPRGGVRHVIPHKANYLVPTVPDEAMSGSSGSSRSTDRSRLVTAASPSDVSTETRWFKLQLLQALINDDHDQIDLLVSFVMRSGVDLIARHVDDALERGARIRLLTTDYLGITDPGALGFFLDREDLQVRVFSDPSTSFHPKAYIFRSSRSGGGTAFVGSSNLSRSGISAGVEWNIQTRSLGDLSDEFEALWNDERSVRLSADWLSNNNATRRVRRPIPPVGDGPTQDQTLVDDESPLPDSDGEWEPAPEPWSVQADALAALEATRVEGYNAGLVVMATGLGKTWLAAFDSTRTEVERVLFVAHREEILTQARDVFRQIRPTASLTMFSGSERSPNGDVVFATIQSLHRNLSRFEPAAFDYIVVDEFHHASAMSYRRALAHFRPKFMLGLTATPDRADAADLLALCADNLVYECGLVRGVNEGLLSPFTYRAIPDVASYENIPWRSGRFDAEALTAELSTVARAEQVLAEWRKLTETDPEGAGTGANPSAARSLGTARSLGFCCTIAHADFMAEQFRKHDVAAVAVHSGAGSAPRAESIERLGAGEIDIIFTVDLFNEGIDIPNVDSVFMLRPTESPVVFYQQLGRGLRRAEGKERLEVIDLVGNHRSFLLKARLLAELAGRSHLTNREALEYLAAARSDLADGSVALPEGCSIIVDPEVVDLLGRIARPGRERDRMVDLVRQWADDHDGRRPSALEVALVTGKPLELRSDGGWFGFLARLGVLTNFEANVRESVPGFFEWIEHGSYTKSYKLVTLRALVRSGSLIGCDATR
ncbi:MAG: DEAD/DEAH box helicase family protein [Microthrixaceae bacterium]